MAVTVSFAGCAQRRWNRAFLNHANRYEACFALKRRGATRPPAYVQKSRSSTADHISLLWQLRALRLGADCLWSSVWRARAGRRHAVSLLSEEPDLP
eukprot:6206982-Pleurochrysis_carterae.AAC.3